MLEDLTITLTSIGSDGEEREPIRLVEDGVAQDGTAFGLSKAEHMDTRAFMVPFLAHQLEGLPMNGIYGLEIETALDEYTLERWSPFGGRGVDIEQGEVVGTLDPDWIVEPIEEGQVEAPEVIKTRRSQTMALRPRA